MMIKFEKHSKKTAFIFGMLSVLAFAPYHFVLMAVMAFSVLMFLLLRSSSMKKSFAIAYWFGFGHFAVGFSWIGNALLIEPEKFGWLYPIVLISAGAFFGLFFAFPTLVIRKNSCSWQKWISFCAAFVLFEWVRSFLFTGFPWNLMGYSLAFSNEMIQAASVGGSYLLSLIAICSYSILGLWLDKMNIKTLVVSLVFAMFVCLATYSYGVYRIKTTDDKDTSVVVRIVQPSIPQTMKWGREVRENNFNQYVELSASGSDKIPDIVVWGETASPFMLDEDDEHRQKIVKVLGKNSYLVAGQIMYHFVDGAYRPHNSMIVLNKKGDVVGYYNKSHLVPFGEYIPLRKYLPNFLQPVANAIGEFGKGEGPKIVELDGLPSIGGIICYEVIFPGKVVDENLRPDFLVNLTNDGWYGDSFGPYQHFVATKMRAVEEGITIIRAANNGISGMITPLGKEKGILPLNYVGFSDVKLVKSLHNKTIYASFDNWLIVTFCLILLFLGIIRIKCGRML